VYANTSDGVWDLIEEPPLSIAGVVALLSYVGNTDPELFMLVTNDDGEHFDPGGGVAARGDAKELKDPAELSAGRFRSWDGDRRASPFRCGSGR
jgi:hypothetical protein